MCYNPSDFLLRCGYVIAIVAFKLTSRPCLANLYRLRFQLFQLIVIIIAGATEPTFERVTLCQQNKAWFSKNFHHLFHNLNWRILQQGEHNAINISVNIESNKVINWQFT